MQVVSRKNAAAATTIGTEESCDNAALQCCHNRMVPHTVTMSNIYYYYYNHYRAAPAAAASPPPSPHLLVLHNSWTWPSGQP